MLTGVFLKKDPAPKSATRLWPNAERTSGQFRNFDGSDGPATKHRVPVSLGTSGNRRQKSDVIAEDLRDRGSLILAPRTQSSVVEFLQGNDIRRLLGNDAGNARAAKYGRPCRCNYGHYSS